METELPRAFAYQVAGHTGLSPEGGSLVEFGQGKVAKPVGKGYFAGEDRFYRELANLPSLQPFCAAYYGTKTIQDHTFVILEDLTHGIHRPCIVDIKLGTCTVASDAPWPKRVTHLARDRLTTTRARGVRLIGVWHAGSTAGSSSLRLGKPWGKALQPEGLVGALRRAFTADGVLCSAALAYYVARLEELLRALEGQSRWQLVSSSLLFVFEPEAAAGRTGATPRMRMIDFAHSYPLEGCGKDYGYLFGLRNLHALMRMLLEEGGGHADIAEPSSPSARTARQAIEAARSELEGGEADGCVPLHLDEVYEGLSHTAVGPHLSEWRGFELDENSAAAARACAGCPAPESTTRHAVDCAGKCVLLRSRWAGYTRPRVLALGIVGRHGGGAPCRCRVVRGRACDDEAGAASDLLDGGAAGLHAALRELLSGEDVSRRGELLEGLLSQLDALSSALQQGSFFQFGGSTLSFVFEGRSGRRDLLEQVRASGGASAAGADGRQPPRVCVSDLQSAVMTRAKSHDAPYLEALRQLRAAVAAATPHLLQPDSMDVDA